MKRRNLLQLGLLGSAASLTGAATAASPKGLNIVEASAADLQAAMAQGRCSALQLVDAYLARI